MLRFEVSRGIGRYFQMLLAVALWSLVNQPVPAESIDRAQAEMLADLSAQIVSCSVHPCLGDEAEVELAGKLITDDLYYYSSINDLYPQTKGVLQGLVEWDSDNGPLGEAYLKVLDFHSAPEVLLHELERVFRGCRMDQDDDAGKEWSCLYETHDGDDLLIDVYFGPGLVLLEIG